MNSHPAKNDERVPATHQQEGVWFHAHIHGAAYWNFTQKKALKGALQIAALKSALERVVSGHASLQTNFRFYQDRLFQVIHHPSSIDPIFHHEKYASTEEGLMAATVRAASEQEENYPFDLEHEPLIRFKVLAFGDIYFLILTMHHIVTDAVSMQLFWQELIHYYNAFAGGGAIAAALAENPYFDYAVEQDAFAKTPAYAQQERYWQQKLSIDLPFLNLGFCGRGMRATIVHREMEIPAALAHAIRDLSLKKKVLYSAVFQAAYFIFLHKYSKSNTVIIANVVNGRGFGQRNYTDVIGLFAKRTLNLQQFGEEDSVAELLGKVHADLIASFRNSDLPYEALVRFCNKGSQSGAAPLFQASFNVIKTKNDPAGFNDLAEYAGLPTANSLVGDQQYDIGLSIIDKGHSVWLRLDLKCDEYWQDLPGHLLEGYLKVLREVVDAPSQKIAAIDLLGDEQRRLLQTFEGPQVGYPVEQTLVSLFTDRAARRPEATALLFEEERMSYRELDERSNRLGHYLQGLGVREETPVAICIEKGMDMIVAILAVLKAGGVYVPIDPGYPVHRIEYMLADTGAPVLLTSRDSLGALPSLYAGKVVAPDAAWEEEIAACKDSVPATLLRPDHLAYIIYTSGSTGKPKGVMIEHRHVVRLLMTDKPLYDFHEGDVWTLFHSFCFDFSVWEIFGALLSGGRLVIVPKDVARDVQAFGKLLITRGVTVLNQTPSAFYGLQDHLTAAEKNISVRLVIFGGEALDLYKLSRWRQCYPGSRLINMYGITETTVHTTFLEIEERHIKSHMSLVGNAIPTMSVYILDSRRQLLPVGIIGELYVGGEGLARGYLNQAALTAEKFSADPFSGEAGARLYRSGDLGRWLPDGNIEYISRMDDQVKVRGYRIELGEIESCVLQSGLVQQCVVLVHQGGSDKARLVGYAVAAHEHDFDRDGLLQYLRERLPEYMTPAIWVRIDSIPLTANGKIDKRALPDPEPSSLSTAGYVAPRSEVESALAGIWQQLLGVERVGIHDHFFELGGHSLLATRVVSMISATLDMEIQIRDLFLYPTLSQLAAHVQQTKKGVRLPAITREVRPARIPLSFSQERLYFIDQLEGSIHYHIPWTLRLQGRLDAAALSEAFRRIVHRHEILRTVIREADELYYQQVMDADSWEMEWLDISDEAKDAQALSALITRLVDKPFDLATDPMLRVHLIGISEQEHILVMVLHHIAADGWSCEILIRELNLLYPALVIEPASLVHLPSLPVQYADYALWQRRWLTGELLSGKLDYWRRQLAGIQPLELPTDHRRPAVQSTRGAYQYRRLDAGLQMAVAALARSSGATLFMTLLAAFKVLLYRYSNQQDICVGTPVAGRTQQETDGLIGFFVNTLPLRSQLRPDDSFRSLLEQVKETTLAAYDHQDVPFEKVVEMVVKERDMSRNPLFQVMFTLQHVSQIPALRLGDLVIADEPSGSGQVKFDLTVTISEDEHGLGCQFAYCSDLYAAETIERMSDHFVELVRSIVANPEQRISDCNMLPLQERQALLQTFNDMEADYPREQTLVSLFTDQAARRPEAAALLFGQERMSYRQLDERSNRLGHYLRGLGVREETPVAICIEKGMDMVVAILAVLKAGGVYVPIDPAYPVQRIEYMLEDTGAPVVLTSRDSLGSLPSLYTGKIVNLDEQRDQIAACEDSVPATLLRPDNLAYIIYTSGSTGRPKGVMIEHRHVVRLFMTDKPLYDFNERDVWTLFHSFCFDLSVWEIFGALLFGGRVVIVPRVVARDVQAFGKLLIAQGVTVLTQTPSAFYVLQDHLTTAEKNISLRLVIFAGEALDLYKLARWRQCYPASRLINMYGITETTVHTTFLEIEESHINSHMSLVGRAIPTMSVYILDSRRQLLPIGIIGELYVGGEGLARGYLNQAALTAERFIADPFSGEAGARLYRSGDLGRWLPDGNIEYIGRIDDQVKIRGYRIELGEIVSCVLQSGLVEQCVVLARRDGAGDPRLVGYVVLKQDPVFDRDGLVQYLRERLPEYMAPAIWVRIDSIPLTANGKIDKRALPDPEPSSLSTAGFVAPRNEPETALAGIWRQLLGVERVGIHDNFFELGGNSLLIMKLANQLKGLLGKKIGVITLFQYPTIKSLMESLHENGEAAQKEEVFQKEDLVKELDKFIHIHQSI